MKSYRMPTYCSPMVLFTLVLLLIASFPVREAQAAPQYSIDCDGCHRMPPLDSADGSREPEDGGVKGNHDTHSDATSASCVKCHGPGVISSTNHMDKLIQVQGDINFLPAGGRYARIGGVFMNQTSMPPLGNCSNVNCHFEAPTPIWGSAKYQRPELDASVCGACHGDGANAAPADGNHPNSQMEKGLKHAAYYGTGAASCVKCHPDHAVLAAPFAHATSARPGGRALQLSFDLLPNTGGSYSKPENLAYPNYLPSQTPAGDRNGSCSAMYCHSNGAGSGPLTPAVWGGTLDCAGCHGFDANAGANSMATDQHGAHVKNAARVGWDIGCQECHSATTTTGSSVTSVANHVDRSVNVKFDNAVNKESDATTYNGSPTVAAAGAVKAALTAPGSCANLYCHSVGNLDAGTLVEVAGAGFRAIAWNGGAIGCDSCHGNQAGASHPVYASGPAASSTANSHVEHVEAKGYGCDYCHLGTTLDAALPPATVKAGGVHLNRAEDVNFLNFGALSGSYDGATGVKSCSATYCHSSGEATPAAPLAPAVWGGSLDCRGCHGGDAGHAGPMASGRHAGHMNAAAKLGLDNNFACAECHAQTVAGFENNTTLGNSLRHVDTFRDYSGVRAGQIGAFYAEQTCGNLYCHSSGEAAPTFRNMTGSKSWGASGSIGCNGCHGYGEGAFTPVAGEPNYVSGPSTGNSHEKHTIGANMTDSIGCAVCHRTTVDRSVAGRMKDYSSAHLNGLRDVAFAPMANITGAYLPASKSCSNTYCHGQRETVAWGTPGPLLCNDCHKADATLAGAHASHWEAGSVTTSYTAAAGNLTGSAERYSFECSSCHLGAHSAGPTTGGNAAEVFFGYSSTGLRGSYSYGAVTDTDGPLQWSNGTCSATYCHSQGDSAKSEGKGSAGMNWGSPAKTLRCDGCHGGDASKPATVISTGLHRSHIDPSQNASLGAGNGLRCVDCHAKTTGFANNTTLSDKRLHVNKFRDYSGVMAGGSASYSQAGKTCAAIYCHSNGKSGTPANQFRDPAPWDQSTSYGCNGCHGQAEGVQLDPAFPSNAQLGAPNYLNAGAVGGSSSNSHKLHVQAMGIDSANLCYSCHAGTMDKFLAKFRPYSTQHLNGVAEVRFGTQSAPGFTLISSVSRASWDAQSRTCSTVACHSNGKGGYQDAKWGESSNCALCHALNKLSRGHAFHVYTSSVNNPTFYDNYTANRSNSAAAPRRYNYGCANCHPVVNPNHMKGEVLIDLYPGNQNVVGFLRSRNGSLIVNSTGGVPAGTAGSGTTLEGNKLYCDNVYCHSNGYSTDLRYVKTPDWFAGNFSDTGDRCANCHGNSPNSDPADMPGSPSHFNQDWLGTATEGGHFMGIHAKTITNKGTAESQETFIGLLSPGATEPASHGVASSSTTVSCNTCHWDTIQTSANFGSIQCSGCHTTPDTRAYAAIWDKGTHINGQVKVAFQPGQVKSKAQLRDVSFATVSSSTLWHRNGVYKSATGFDSSKLSLSAAGSWSGANCSNVVCHFNNQVPWTVPTGTSIACDSCHSSM